MAKYKDIADTIKKDISNGTYPVEKKLPDQATLGEKFGVSRVTVKKALDLLTVEGLIYSVQGSGSYVKKNALHRSEQNILIGQNVGLTTAIKDKTKLKSEVLDFTVRFPNEEEQERLMISKETPVYSYERLRILEGKPYSLEQTTMPVSLVPGLTEEVLKDSVYRYIKDVLGLSFGDNRQTIRASQPDQLDSEYLNCSEMEPVLEVEKVMFFETGTPFEYSIVHHRFDMVELSFLNK